MKKRVKQHVMETESETLLNNMMPSNWIVRPVLKDYGVDYEIEIVDQEAVSGNRIWVQLKAVNKSSFSAKEYEVEYTSTNTTELLKVSYLPFSMDNDDLDYALKCAFPILLFVADLSAKEIYWIPMRDEVIGSLIYRTPDWRSQKSSTLHLPEWNKLSLEASRDFPGLRWYALEPARMYAFATIHYYYHEFQYRGRLSGYSIGDGWIDHGEKEELIAGLQLAKNFISATLQEEVLFGSHGLDFFSKTEFEHRNVVSIGYQLQEALEAADRALALIAKAEYTFALMAETLSKVDHAIRLMSTMISSYQGYRQRFLLTKISAMYRSIKGPGSSPAFPTRRQHPEK